MQIGRCFPGIFHIALHLIALLRVGAVLGSPTLAFVYTTSSREDELQ